VIESSLPLASDEVRVYYAWTDALERDDLAAQCLELLSDDECARQARFHFAEDRRSYLAAHALTRSVLAPLLGVAPRELSFSIGEHGKPELIAAGSAPAVRFNLSHTRGLVACAVSLGRAVGVDVERIDRRVDIDKLSRSVFSETERTELMQFTAEEDKRQRFFQLWTVKEAYIKAVGRGLSLPLRSISVQFPAAPGPALRPCLAFAEPIVDDGNDWWLAVHGLPPSHVLSVVLQAAEPVQATTRVWPWSMSAL
jgi:4'-phosphopantetheinyl transferase